MKKLSRNKQIEFLELWVNLRNNDSDDRTVLETLSVDYFNVYGECDEYKFCRHSLDSLKNWNGGFAMAMNDYFDNDLIILVKSCKMTGNADKPLTKLIKESEEWSKLNSSVVMKLIMIIGFILFSISAIYSITVYALPAMMHNLTSASPSGFVKFNLEIGNFLQNYLWSFAIIILGVIGALVLSSIYYVGNYRAVMDNNVPLYRYYSAIHASKFYSLLNVTVNNGGMTLRQSLEMLQKSNLMNRYINFHIDEMLYRLEMRKARSASGKKDDDLNILDTGLLPNILRLKLRVASKSRTQDSKGKMLDIISNSLINDFGKVQLKKITYIANATKYISLLLIFIPVVSIIDLVTSVGMPNM